MNVLFLTLLGFESLDERNIYTDLLREFVKNGHHVYVISPIERRNKIKTHVVKDGNSTILRLKIGNTQKTNIIEKGISTIMIEHSLKRAIKKYFSSVRYDLLLYTTPPITLVAPIKYVKKRDNAKTYLLLKDIFPQNAVDMCLLSKSGFKGMLYKHFRKKEKQLYSISDCIGCMSEANVDYIIMHNPELITKRVEVCPNSIEVIDKSVDEETRKQIRAKYNIPADKKVFVYGGNLGRPQGIAFIIDCLRRCKDISEAFFLIVGDGTEYGKIQDYIDKERQENVRLMRRLPKEDYDVLVGACDVGLIFLDYKFTIPNFPSRLLSYMQAKIPVLVATDMNTDIGKIVVENELGWWCLSNDVEGFRNLVEVVVNSNISILGERAFKMLEKKYTAEKTYRIIILAINNFKSI